MCKQYNLSADNAIFSLGRSPPVHKPEHRRGRTMPGAEEDRSFLLEAMKNNLPPRLIRYQLPELSFCTGGHGRFPKGQALAVSWDAAGVTH